MTSLELSYDDLPAEPRPDPFEDLRRAEPHAVAQAYDDHHGAVRAFAQRLLGDASVAEDLVHDVFVCLPNAAARFRGDASLRTFLISIAVNRARHFVRAASRQRAAMARLALEEPTPSDDPEQQVRRRELANALSRALETLPLDQRVAFVLCEVEQRGCAEAAQIIGVPDGTVKSRLFHARRKLREALEREGVR